VRPLDRGNGTISIPLGFETNFDASKEPVIEIVSVLEKAIPAGRSELALTLPQIAVPVQAHEWRVLLPDGPKYRFRSSDLRPVPVRYSPAVREPWAVLQSAPGVITDRINVGGNEAGQQSQYVGPGGSAAILGKVTDDKGQFLPGVTVTLSGQLAVVTNAQGAFVFRGLPAGHYSLKAELEGFSSSEEYSNIPLVTGQTLQLDVRISPAMQGVITVTAESPMLDERKLGNTTTTKLDERGRGGNADLGKNRREKDQNAAAEERKAKALFAQEARGLQQGLVGGVKPLPIAIPESGKVLFLTGVLPPAKVGVELEVKGKR
jgi:hypothetical protein